MGIGYDDERKKLWLKVEGLLLFGDDNTYAWLNRAQRRIGFLLTTEEIEFHKAKHKKTNNQFLRDMANEVVIDTGDSDFDIEVDRLMYSISPSGIYIS